MAYGWLVEVGEALWKLFKKPPRPSIPVPPDAKHRVLVVEDNDDDAGLLIGQLKHLGFECTWVKTCEGAEALIRRNNISIAFIDMRFPRMAGWDLIPIIWEHSKTTLIVALCGERADICRIKHTFKFVVLMEKPTSVEMLEEMLSFWKLKLL